MRRLVAASVLSLALLPALSACGGNGDTTASDTGGSTTPSATSPTSGPPSASTPTTPSSAPTSGPTSTPSSTPTGPACGDVWVTGAKLPTSYQGCVDATGYVPADKLGCSSGQRLVRYQPHFWAASGGVIHHAKNLNSDHDYRAAIASCRG